MAMAPPMTDITRSRLKVELRQAGTFTGTAGQRNDRLGRTTLCEYPGDGADDAEGDNADTFRRDQRAEQFAAVGGKHDARRREREQQGAGIIDLGAAMRFAIGQHEGKPGQHDEADRHVDQEDRTPAEEIAHRAAEHGADRARGHQHEAGIALIARPLAGLEQVGIDGKDRYHDAAAAEALQHAGGNQRVHRDRKAADRGADCEDRDRCHHYIFAAEEIAELAIDRHDGAQRQEVGGADPAEALEMAEFADDRRQRRGNDLIVQRCHKHGRHQEEEEDKPATRIRHERRRRELHVHEGVIPIGYAFMCCQHIFVNGT